jgi:FKBP-type peptidyl-prolyl cis-trans isomerase (trigger factor)
LVLEQIAELEELEADPDELEAEIDRFSEMAGEEAGEMREMLESEEGRQSVASDLVMTLAQEHVVQIGKGEIEEEEEVEAEAETEEEAEAEVEAEEEEPTGEAKAGEAG